MYASHYGLALAGYTPVGTPLTKVYADDQVAPSAPTTAADHSGRTRTTAGVDWDGFLTVNAWNNAPSLVSVGQELADSFDSSVIQLLIDDDGTAGPANNSEHTLHYLRSYNGSTTLAPKLHIEYTAGGGGTAVPVFERHYRMLRQG